MKKILPIVFLLFLSISSFVQQKKTRIVFFGDSITEAGVKPTGYISKINTALRQKGDSAAFELIGAGVSGNKVYDLFLRLDTDVLAKQPDVVVIWVGVNDVWHKRSYGTGTDPDKFAKFYHAVIDKLQAKNIKVFLCTPAVIGEKTDFSNELDGDLNAYSTIIRQIAAEKKCTLIDLRKAFLDYNIGNNKENKPSGILTTDRVHLNDAGNELVAAEMQKALTLQNVFRK
jgi:isoamyl acetate esterase